MLKKGEKSSSERFCKSCNKKTKWIFNNRIGHSECSDCGFRYIRKNPFPKKRFDKNVK